MEDILDKTIEIVRDIDHASQEAPSVNGGGIRLFKRAPLGIVFDHTGKRKENLKQVIWQLCPYGANICLLFSQHA